MIRTVPPGAKVWVDGRFVGTTPTTFVVDRSQWKKAFPCRLEKEGFHPRDCEMREIVGGGRVTGGLFTVGISWLFKPPITFESEYEFTLERDPSYRTEAPVSPRAP